MNTTEDKIRNQAIFRADRIAQQCGISVTSSGYEYLVRELIASMKWHGEMIAEKPISAIEEKTDEEIELLAKKEIGYYDKHDDIELRSWIRGFNFKRYKFSTVEEKAFEAARERLYDPFKEDRDGGEKYPTFQDYKNTSK